MSELGRKKKDKAAEHQKSCESWAAKKFSWMPWVAEAIAASEIRFSCEAKPPEKQNKDRTWGVSMSQVETSLNSKTAQ